MNLRALTLAVLIVVGIGHTAQAGGVIDPAELLDRIIALEADVNVLKADAAPIPARLDGLDAKYAQLAETVERDHDARIDSDERARSEASRNDVQASRLNGIDDRLDTHLGRLNNDDDRLDLQSGRLATHDQRFDNQASRLDAIPDVARCILPPLAYRHVTVRTAKGKTVVALVPVKDAPLGFHAGWTWLSRINAQCAKALK